MTAPSSEPRRHVPRLPAAGWIPDPARLDLERYWDGRQWTARVRDRASRVEYRPDAYGTQGRGSRGHSEPRRLNGWIVGLLIALGVTVPAAGYVDALPTWIPWPDSWVQSVPHGPDVAYPVFGSDDLVLFLARSLVAQDSSINVMFATATMNGGVDRVQDAMSEAITQNPYAFVDGYAITSTNGVTYVEPTYLYDDAEAERRQAETSQAVAVLVVTSGAALVDQDAEKVALIHDAIVRTATYDWAAYDAIEAGGELSDVAASQEAYGILVDHTAVCTGYAEAFLLAANAVGLPAVVVTGEASSGVTTGGHAWDRVFVAGAWRVVDVTWDDAGDGLGSELATGLQHDFLLLDADDPKLDTRVPDLDWVVDKHAGGYE